MIHEITETNLRKVPIREKRSTDRIFRIYDESFPGRVAQPVVAVVPSNMEHISDDVGAFGTRSGPLGRRRNIVGGRFGH